VGKGEGVGVNATEAIGDAVDERFAASTAATTGALIALGMRASTTRVTPGRVLATEMFGSRRGGDSQDLAEEFQFGPQNGAD
jgi:hypothetical protein